MLKETDIKRFQKLYRLRFGIELDHDTAHRKLAILVRQMEVMYRPITVEQAKEYVNEDVNNEQTRPRLHS